MSFAWDHVARHDDQLLSGHVATIVIHPNTAGGIYSVISVEVRNATMVTGWVDITPIEAGASNNEQPQDPVGNSSAFLKWNIEYETSLLSITRMTGSTNTCPLPLSVE